MKKWIKLRRKTLGKWFHNQKDKKIIGTKWVFINKLNEDGQVTKNKARFVCKGYEKIE